VPGWLLEPRLGSGALGLRLFHPARDEHRSGTGLGGLPADPLSLSVFGSPRCAGTGAQLRDTGGELRELRDGYDSACYREWALILDSWSGANESGIDLAPLGTDDLGSQGAFAHAVLVVAVR
jgi:hypothetical protein